jgi:type IV secretory pathway VirB6-like protein
VTYVTALKAQPYWALATMVDHHRCQHQQVVLVLVMVVMMAVVTVMLLALMEWGVALMSELVSWQLLALVQVHHLPGKMCTAPETLLH